MEYSEHEDYLDEANMICEHGSANISAGEGGGNMWDNDQWDSSVLVPNLDVKLVEWSYWRRRWFNMLYTSSSLHDDT